MITNQSLLRVTFLFFLSMLAFRGNLSAADDVTSLSLIVNALNSTQDTKVKAALLRGTLKGLEGRRNVTAPPQWSEASSKLLRSDDANVRELAQRLAQLLGDENAAKAALVIVLDTNIEISRRRSALHSLVTQRYESLPIHLKTLLAEPAMQVDAIRASGVFGADETPRLLIEKYSGFDAPGRRAVLETLSERKNFATDLLTAIKDKQIDSSDIPPHVARSLQMLLGDGFTAIYGDVRELANDRAAEIEKFKTLLSPEAVAKADAGRGRAVFQKTCGACHLLYGTGGLVGPDLTGSNRANLDYLLLNSVDPSFDVPAGYRMVIIQTIDGRVISGVIGEEDGQRIVLKTADQPEVVILKGDIEARKVSPLSIMPDGQLNQLKEQEVVDLVKYLQTTEQVEISE